MKYVFLLFLPLLAFAQGGNVVLNGTIISGNGTPATGYTAATTLDGNPLTAFAAPPGTGNGPWVGIDAGQAVTLVSVIVSPRAGDASQIWALAWSGCIIEADVVSNFATAVTLYTFPSWATGLPDVYSGLMKTIPMSPSQAYRYYRFRDPVSHGNVGELRFVVQYVSGLTAMPVAPVITPGGGAFLSGSVTVSMSTATTGSTIYYTTNGTAPACGTSTLYSAPFALTVSNPPTQVQAVACNSGLSTTQSLDLGNQYYRGYGWNAGDQMYDDSGNEMETHAGSMLWAEGKWWWIGMNQSWGGSVANWALGHPGLWLYSSTDMYTWTKVGQNVTDLGVVNVERPHVIYNALHNNYVMWMKAAPYPGTGNSYAAVLTGPHPYGPWTVLTTTYDPATTGTYVGFRDNTLFVDTNGTAYTAFTDGTNTQFHIMQLSTDYTTAVGSVITPDASGGREGPALFRNGSTYFLVTSQSTNASLTNDDVEYQTASSPLGPWSALSGSGTFYTKLVTSTVYNAQATQVIKLPWMSNAYVYLADSWTESQVTTPAGSTWYITNNTTPLFLPLTFPTSTTVKAPTLTDAPSPFNKESRWSYSGMFPMPGAMAR
jgi:hypothetical protein